MHRRKTGFSLIELLACTVGAAVCVLGHAASVLNHQKVATELDERGVAIVTTQRFLERMRADTDWNGLYARLRPRSVESADDADLASLGADLALPALPPTAYYSDFESPASLGNVTVLVQVPVKVVGGVAALRESAFAPRYGLPADLNRDGVIDSDPHDDDREVLPVVVHLRWQRPGRAAQEIVVPTWLRRFK